VLLISIDRPEVLNAANERLHREFSEVRRVVDRDDPWPSQSSPGREGHFRLKATETWSAGGDRDMVDRMTTDYATTFEQWCDAKAMVDEMLASIKPIVSAINGVAVGAGLAVALLADVSVMGESARLSDGHARLGVAAGDHVDLLWPLLCGMARAKYYLMTADLVDRPEAERIGLVTRCVTDDRVLPEALAVAEWLAAGSRTAVQWTKRVMNQWMAQAAPVFGESLALEMLGFLGPDAIEGIRAVRERRLPDFPSARLYETVTRVPIGVYGKMMPALAGGISTHPSL
jgi:enoyl-CoA hydratase